MIWNDYLDAGTVTAVTEDDGNNNPVLKVSLTKNVDKTADYSFTVLAEAASATGKLSIQSGKMATKVQIGDLNDVIAAHDKDVYIPVIAYDAQGNQLSLDDLTSTANVDRIKVSVSGVNTSTPPTAIETSGEHRGTIHLTNIGDSKNGAVSVNVFIATANTTSNDNKNVHDSSCTCT